MKLNDIHIYRITHIDNIPHIIENGITHKNSPKSNPNFVSIGDNSLINKRDSKKVKINNGELLSFSYKSIVLGDFIPFYFGIKMPMLYIIKNGYHNIKATPNESIIYLVCPINNIIQLKEDYYFSDGHATNKLTCFYNKAKIDELPNIIDWKSIRAPYWDEQRGNLDIKRKKQAELLVSNDIPFECIVGFCCYNENTKNILINMGVKNTIKVTPSAYY